ncbi:hypothetical protein GGTG_01633 [Gaeumannomyces tritici R3-111a-1]|uniref:Uncharacterized protein n=1 Tax=Gaeumannomyces tritici (strain R3-111a-1) TaxID=644352 RepID=J3NK51_GAET3|nr:hypothetical protein GGTG_01633 [Gaeumannomyces tritici R3-111a-1]EJT81655.1 hypothetical protein GGTG_01633 [Gaeumannomyces tritici R3-111a-1]
MPELCGLGQRPPLIAVAFAGGRSKAASRAMLAVQELGRWWGAQRLHWCPGGLWSSNVGRFLSDQ